MKKMTCRNLRGACEEVIVGETPEQMGENSKQHVMKMIQIGDEDHKAAMQDMMMLSKQEQQFWFDEFKKKFNKLPDA